MSRELSRRNHRPHLSEHISTRVSGTWLRVERGRCPACSRFINALTTTALAKLRPRSRSPGLQQDPDPALRPRCQDPAPLPVRPGLPPLTGTSLHLPASPNKDGEIRRPVLVKRRGCLGNPWSGKTPCSCQAQGSADLISVSESILRQTLTKEQVLSLSHT